MAGGPTCRTLSRRLAVAWRKVRNPLSQRPFSARLLGRAVLWSLRGANNLHNPTQPFVLHARSCLLCDYLRRHRCEEDFAVTFATGQRQGGPTTTAASSRTKDLSSSYPPGEEAEKHRRERQLRPGFIVSAARLRRTWWNNALLLPAAM